MNRSTALDGLRVLAFLGVFVVHIPHGFPPWLGSYGVQCFFVLSGFLITRGLLQNPSLKTFYFRRSLRIFPLYYASVLYLFLTDQLPGPLWHLFYLQNVRTYLLKKWEGPFHFWSLGVEEWFYLLFPLLLLTAKDRPRRILLLIGITKLSRAFFAFYDPNYWAGVLLPVSGEYLLWGALAASLHLEDKLPRLLMFFGFVLSFTGPLVLTHLHYDLALFLGGTLDGIGFALFITGLWSSPTSLFSRALSIPPLPYLGKISYGLYVYHGLVLWGMIHTPSWGGDTWVHSWLVCFPYTLLLSILSYHLFEAPILRFSHRKPAPVLVPPQMCLE